MKHTALVLASLLLAQSGRVPTWAEETAAVPTAVNQVFQFVYSGTCTDWSDGSTNSATSYLWIPENCRKLRGLLILCANVPEHRLVGHPTIRRVCAANDLGIIWSARSFLNWSAQKPGHEKMCDEHSTTVAFLERLLEGLARKSGYDEVATVPWLPMGESRHMRVVKALLETMPQRCIAGITIKNTYLPSSSRQIPILAAFGSAQEWGQDKTDIRTRWNDVGQAYAEILNEREKNRDWPLSYIIDGASGHFDCSERLTEYFARYINLVSKARLSDDGSVALKPISMENGFLADLPVPGHDNQPVRGFAQTAPDARGVPWYFDRASAEEAQAIARINWKAETQLPGLLNESGNVVPFDFNGIMDLKTLDMEPDGITFTLCGTMLDQIPSGFVGAGEKLAKTHGTPEVEWLCGPAAPLGKGSFRIALDRVGGPIYLALRKSGTDTIRSVVQPIRIKTELFRNNDGSQQTIAFDKIPDVKAGVESIPLNARTDAGLPVAFYVDVGPAIVRDGRLVFTSIPPRSRFPIEVTVVAWQWGRSMEPRVKTAESVKQTFKINSP